MVLTGAGLSAESGVPTFRDPDGIWSKYDWRDVATPDGFQRNPTLVLDFYNTRRRAHRAIKPNAAHIALARLEKENGGVTIVTQNIDALHEAAGSTSLIHMHGELFKALCTFCKHRFPCHDDLHVNSSCPFCGLPGGMRPDVVWFGEMPYQMGRITGLLGKADLFVSIGTSGHVYPAAGFVEEARVHGAHTVELNLEPSEGASLFDEAIYGRATEVVPAFVERLLLA
ncbi:MAG: NAD-dependent deacylase [Hyphomicrobium sp.]|uniref:NAD-dependent deacylase n=1 Tax=Hyphomicrobium sp. TaxID=82 RepID=UPI0039E4508D